MALDSHAYLRKSFDGKEGIVSGGHGIIKTAGATIHAERMKRIPVWALDDQKIKQYIHLRFPKAATNSEQRKLAERMVRIIYLYYRVGATEAAIAEELKITGPAVKFVIFRLNRAMKSPLKPSHRPKKKGATIQATGGTSGDDSHITL